ncbi:MAG TPA: hypothetical protein VGC71_10365 [Gaiellales bacterium]|jgi:hypothetical protein
MAIKERSFRAGGTELALLYGDGVRIAPGVGYDRHRRRLMARLGRVRVEARREPAWDQLTLEQQHARLLERDW